MQEVARIIIPARGVRSLCWVGDSLVDFAAGGVRYPVQLREDLFRLELRPPSPGAMPEGEFDHAVASPDGKYAVLCQRLGTKGLLLKEGKPLRALSRNPFKANEFEYPAALFTTPKGKTVLAHCPEHYGRLELEEVETGRRLTRRTTPIVPFFHSRLAASPDGRFLISAGWVRRPWDALCLFEVEEVLKTPSLLDQYGSVDEREECNLAGWGDEDVHSAAFLGNDFLVLANAEEEEDEDGKTRFVPNRIGLYSLKERRLLTVASLDAVAGTLMPVGRFVVGFFEYPKLIEIETGDLFASWPEIFSGRQNSSLIRHAGPLPPLALDPEKKRFAVASEEAITVIQLGARD